MMEWYHICCCCRHRCSSYVGTIDVCLKSMNSIIQISFFLFSLFVVDQSDFHRSNESSHSVAWTRWTNMQKREKTVRSDNIGVGWGRRVEISFRQNESSAFDSTVKENRQKKGEKEIVLRKHCRTNIEMDKKSSQKHKPVSTHGEWEGRRERANEKWYNKLFGLERTENERRRKNIGQFCPWQL